MFEMMDPSDEAEVWAEFVPPVPPTDDEVIDVDDLDGWSGLDEFEDGVEGEGYGVLPDLDSAGALALAEFEQALEAERLAGWMRPGFWRRPPARSRWSGGCRPSSCGWRCIGRICMRCWLGLVRSGRVGSGWFGWVGTGRRRWRSSHRPSSVRSRR